jgi:hypothetical protein
LARPAGASLPKPDARVRLAEEIVAKAQAVQRAGAEVLDDNVGGARQIGDDLARLRVLEVQRHA